MTASDCATDPMPRVGVIGTGTMGAAMARRLLDSGIDVRVWSRHPASTMPLVDLGATAFWQAADAASDADVVISMLPTAEATATVMFEEQVLGAMRPGAAWAQMATIGVEPTQRLAAEARTQRPDVLFVDAPVSGSRTRAETGQLLILASGPDSAGKSLESVFAALGRATLWLGPAGAGRRTPRANHDARQSRWCRAVRCVAKGERTFPRACASSATWPDPWRKEVVNARRLLSPDAEAFPVSVRECLEVPQAREGGSAASWK